MVMSNNLINILKKFIFIFIFSIFTPSLSFADVMEFEIGTYTGDSFFGRPHGRGEFVWNEGDSYSGEWVHGNRYGTLMAPLEDAISNRKVMILDIDVKGGLTIMNEFPEETIGIFIEPPGDDVPEQLEVLEERLTERGNEPAKLIKQRLKRFPIEIEYKKDFDYYFVNEDLNETVKEIEKVIKENIK